MAADRVIARAAVEVPGDGGGDRGGSIEIVSSWASVSIEIVLIPAPGQVALWALTAAQVPLGVRLAAESTTVYWPMPAS